MSYRRRVVHRVAKQAAESFMASSAPFVLIVGLLLFLLMGSAPTSWGW